MCLMYLFNPIHEHRLKKAVASCGLYKNDMKSLVPQPALYPIMYDHMTRGRLSADGKLSPARPDGTVPKLLFIGLDAVRADLFPSIKTYPDSGIMEVLREGEAYLGHAGGPKRKFQRCLTGPGWASLLTGTWADKHGITGTLETSKVPTIIRTFNEMGIASSFHAIFHRFFDAFFKNDAEAQPDKFVQEKTDIDVAYNMIEKIEAGQDTIFGVFDRCDGAGHRHGFYPKNDNDYEFAFRDNDGVVRTMLNALKKREARLNAEAKASARLPKEDWLIVVTTDHGGYPWTHGTMFMENLMWSTTWLVLNKKGLF